jgi:hypothetical protein
METSFRIFADTSILLGELCKCNYILWYYLIVYKEQYKLGIHQAQPTSVTRTLLSMNVSRTFSSANVAGTFTTVTALLLEGELHFKLHSLALFKKFD